MQHYSHSPSLSVEFSRCPPPKSPKPLSCPSGSSSGHRFAKGLFTQVSSFCSVCSISGLHCSYLAGGGEGEITWRQALLKLLGLVGVLVLENERVELLAASDLELRDICLAVFLFHSASRQLFLYALMGISMGMCIVVVRFGPLFSQLWRRLVACDTHKTPGQSRQTLSIFTTTQLNELLDIRDF
jgi:hypothetical protein